MLDNFNLNLIKKSKQENGSLIDAIIIFCEEHTEYDFEDVVELLNPIILENLKTEFYTKKYIPAKIINNSMKNLFD